MPNESFANTLVVEVAGRPLPADVANLLTYAHVETSRNLPASCVLRFRDPDRLVWRKGGFDLGGKVVAKVSTAEPGGPRTLLDGEVTAVEADIDLDGAFTEIRALDISHRLFRGRRVAAYPDMAIADVVRSVAAKAHVPIGTIESVPGLRPPPNTQVTQDNISDWEFLSRLADLVGAYLSVTDGRLDFRMPASPSAAPPTTAAATTNPLVLEANRNLISLRAAVSTAEQVPRVHARGWDFEHKSPVTADAVPATPGITSAADAPPALGRRLGAPPFIVAAPNRRTRGEVKAVADAVAERIGGVRTELDGVARGNPKLRPGTAVALAGVGAPFEGQYTLTGARHLFSERAGYTTAFTVAHKNERSLYATVSRNAGGRPPGRHGLMPAVVSDVRDPLKLGRVRLTFPWLSPDYTSGWARTVQLGAGGLRGAWFVPEVGDEVLAGCADGDMDSLFVLGGLHNPRDKPPETSVPTVDGASGQIGVRALVSRKGHRLELVDSDRAGGVLLASGDGAFRLRFDVTGKVLEVEAPDRITVRGKGVSIDAGTGPLELKGQSVSVTALQSAEMSAQTVKVNGQASAELSSSGPLTVKGAIVKIN